MKHFFFFKRKKNKKKSMIPVPVFKPKFPGRIIVTETDRSPVPRLPKELAKPPYQEKPHISLFFITINTNKATVGETQDEYQLGVMRYILRCLFTDDGNLVKFLKIRQDPVKLPHLIGFELTRQDLLNKTYYPDLPWEVNSNKHLEINKGEVGNIRHRVHLHAQFRIIHYTALSIDGKKLKEMAKECLDDLRSEGVGSYTPTNVYIDSRYVPSNEFILGNYMAKDNLPAGKAMMEKAISFTPEKAIELEEQTRIKKPRKPRKGKR